MRVKALGAAVSTMLATGLLVVAHIAPAGAVLVSKTYDLTCSSPIGGQAQSVTGADDAPTDSTTNASFPVTFPGGDSTLPSSALGGAVHIQSFVNLSLTYAVNGGGTFDPTSVSTTGPVTNNGNVVTGTTTFGAGNTTVTLAQPGPLAPGDLSTPDTTINVIAPSAPGAVTISLSQLTTTANVGTTPPGTPIPVVCNVPPDTLTTTNIAASGPQTTVSAGGAVSGDVNTAITLNGSADDPFGTPTFAWTSDTPGCTFADATAAVTTITCTAVGTVAATLTANDGVNPPVHDTATVTVTTPNVPPTVNAGGNVSGEVNDDIALHGSVSDPDSTPTVQWTVDNPNCSFDDDSSADTVIDCSVAGTFAATLTANDGINLPVSDTATVTVNPPPPGLTVKAGPDNSGQTGNPIALTGKITDPGHTFTSVWTSDSPNCTFADPTAVVTTITCTAGGVFAATLQGHDGVNPDTSDTALITVSQPNVAPSVDAGPDVTGVKNSPIALHGTVTDPDSTPTITWSTDTPSCTFGNTHAADTTISCPTTGVALAILTADDGINDPVTDVAVVTVIGNAPPTANAGPDVSTAVGYPVELHGSVSDPDNTPTAQWSTGSPDCTFTDPTAADTMITCTKGGIIAATLTASDGFNTPVTDTALVTVIAPNTPPTVNAGVDGVGIIRHPVALHGVVTDPDSTPTVHWSNGNPNCTFANPNVADTTITCTTAGIFAATLTADDGINEPVSDTALITFTNPACTGVCLNIGDAMTYEGGSLSLPITLTQPQATAVTFTVTIQPTSATNTAINGFGHPASFVSDFKSNPIHNVKIAAGQRQAYVAITALSDNIVEPDETITAVLSNAAGAPGIHVGRAVGTGTIKDATGIAPGTLLLGSESIVEIDACATCKATAKFSAVMSVKPTQAYSARYTTSSTTATAPADYTARNNINLSFAAGGAIQKAITLVTIGDNIPEGTDDVVFTFTSPSTPTLLANGNTGHIYILDND